MGCCESRFAKKKNLTIEIPPHAPTPPNTPTNISIEITKKARKYL